MESRELFVVPANPLNDDHRLNFTVVNMEADTIYEVTKLAFGGSGPARGRLFITCLTREEMLIITDPRPLPTLTNGYYIDMFIPTICGGCSGAPGSARGSRGNFELSEGFIEGSEAFKAVRNYCGGALDFVRHVEDRDVIMKECRKYGSQIQSAKLLGEYGSKEVHVLSYYNPCFA